MSHVSDFALTLRVGYVSSARLSYLALLSLDIINACLPHVALLFLILIKCNAVVPNHIRKKFPDFARVEVVSSETS